MYAKKLFPNKVTFIVFYGGKREGGILFNPVDPLSMPCGNKHKPTDNTFWNYHDEWIYISPTHT